MSEAAFHTHPGALGEALARVARFSAERRADPALAGALERLARFQAARLRSTYADLHRQPRYAEAIDFFETELYGGADFTQRDADVARVAPLMARMLPANVVATIAQAVELNALSHELDRALLEALPDPRGAFAGADYCAAYRSMGRREERAYQIVLIGEIGAGLDVYVTKPFIGTALAMMRRPARMAGLGALQEFLERGFSAFRRMSGAREFLATVDRRERALMESLFAGETGGFPEPGSGGAAIGATTENGVR